MGKKKKIIRSTTKRSIKKTSWFKKLLFFLPILTVGIGIASFFTVKVGSDVVTAQNATVLGASTKQYTCIVYQEKLGACYKGTGASGFYKIQDSASDCNPDYTQKVTCP